MILKHNNVRRPRSLGWKATFTTRFLRWWALTIKRVMRLDITVHNKQALSAEGPVLMVGNHESELDAVVWSAVAPRSVAMFAMSELWKNPLTGWLMRLRGDIAVDRGNPAGRVRAMQNGLNVLRHDGLVGIYPAGGINLIGQDRKWLKGFAEMSLQLANETGKGPTIIAIKLTGTADILPPKPDRDARGGKWLNRHARVTMSCSELIHYDTYKHMTALELTNYVREVCDRLTPS